MKPNAPWKLLAVALGALCMALPATAADVQKADDYASFKAAGTSAMWLVEPGAQASLLSIKGGDVRVEQRFKAGETPVMSLTRPDGSMLPDGHYLWELSESFAGVNDKVWDAENGRTLARHEKGRQKIAVKGRVQRGSFTVKGGLIVDSSLREPEAQ